MVSDGCNFYFKILGYFLPFYFILEFTGLVLALLFLR